MRRLILVVIMAVCGLHAQAVEWKAQWIAAQNCTDKVNTWQVFRKTVNLKAKPQQMMARIAVDSKYWLWVNGEMIVFEGGLKRGPSPEDTYYDEVDIKPYLKTGNNTIAVLTCFFGKEGFSHKNSGYAGLLFDAQSDNVNILSDNTWEATVYDAYGTAEKDVPNYRLPESAISFDGRKDMGQWYAVSYSKHFPAAKILDATASW